MFRNVVLFAGLALMANVARGEQMPKTPGQSLAGEDVVLPDSLRGHAWVVIIGFSKGSQNAVKDWDIRGRKELSEGTEVYEIAVLEDAPKFVRGMITHAIKSGIPASRQSHFLVVVKGEAELKKAVVFAAADEPYVLLVNGAGDIRWRTHGAVNDSALTALHEQVRRVK